MKENRFEIIEDKSTLSFILRQTDDTFVTEYHIFCSRETEWEEMQYNSQEDWTSYIRTEEVKVVTFLNEKKF